MSATASWAAAAGLIAGVPLACAAAPLSASTTGGACGQTTEVMARSCQEQAHGDLFVGQGVCSNLRNADGRATCLKDAGRDFKAALGDCREQGQVRQQICRALGPEPYDPPVRPSEF